MTNRRILVIAPYAFGYTFHIARALNDYPGVNASILYVDRPAFAYRNFMHKASNFISKTFLGKNLKKTFVSQRLKANISELGKQDTIFIIRPDMLDDELLGFIKGYTNKFLAYYYDSTRRFPRKAEIGSFFDTVYSYDKEDVAKFGFQFLTNYIYDESDRSEYEYQFFNISTFDFRFPALEKLAAYIKQQAWTYKILVYNGSDMPATNVEIITEQFSIEDVSEKIKNCKILLEIQRSDQIGLSFRCMEALGHRKKLITTNKDIVNYDFYDSQNILVLDENNYHIPSEFVNSPYAEVTESVLSKYRVENWVRPIFNL
ncbi:hypothetical protein J1N09_10820 [Aureitalea sp. L0-47]|uniref:hypothetical protein n=1 Tax=Aureitalea sp. L0-47 TaxID=2816962 RepID=UPI002237DC8A|nr:hypothetical protein [Aureitalea sp. L0-47]MCW5520334.1 hypothetical protein [Aureitalea sp. L0-47]